MNSVPYLDLESILKLKYGPLMIYTLFKNIRGKTRNFCSLLDFLEDFNLDVPKNFLSIGSGDGSVEIELSNLTGSRFFCIEPSGLLVDKFSQNLKESLKNLECYLGLEKSKFEDSTHFGTYSFIYALHSFYYVPLDERVVLRFKSLLAKNGVALIILTNRKDITSMFSEEFCVGKNINRAENVRDWLEKTDLEFKNISKKIPFDWGSFWENGDISEERRSWVAYFLRKDEKDISLQEWSKVSNFFKEKESKGLGYSYEGFLISI